MIMCTQKQKHTTAGPSGGGMTGTCTCGLDTEYIQLPHQQKTQQRTRRFANISEKLMFVGSVFTVMFLFHAFINAQWTLPWIYVIFTPILLVCRTAMYWRSKLQFFMIDFCYTANTMLMIFLSLPGNENLFRVVFALANGPVLVAAIVYKNSLVFHDSDKVTSVYIHILPALVTFSVRWFPAQVSKTWFLPFRQEITEVDMFWLYLVPFCLFFIHSCCYCLIVNILVRPKDPYLTSYTYLAEKYKKLNILKGPMGLAVVYYSLNWLFCLCSLAFAVFAYSSFIGHIVMIGVVFMATVYNGAGYYMHMLTKQRSSKYA